jgi:hypothetical protein
MINNYTIIKAAMQENCKNAKPMIWQFAYKIYLEGFTSSRKNGIIN